MPLHRRKGSECYMITEGEDILQFPMGKHLELKSQVALGAEKGQEPEPFPQRSRY